MGLLAAGLPAAGMGCKDGDPCGPDLVESEDGTRCVCPNGMEPLPGDRCPAEGDDAGPVTVDAGTDAMLPLDSGVDATAPSDAGPLPDAPTLRWPWNGYRTGSLHAAADAPLRVHPLRPRFRWEPQDDAASFELQVEDSCGRDFRSCDFESPEATVTTTTTDVTLEEALPVSTEPPVGRRYHWRVRACRTDGLCGAWSEVRYLDVGRTTNDFDGDGYADLVVMRDGVGIHVYPGSVDGPPSVPSVTRDETWFSADGRGDVNGDGFDDLLAHVDGIYEGTARDVGEQQLLLGSADGLSIVEEERFSFPGRDGVEAALGDVNADGFSDVLVGRPRVGGSDEGGLQIYFGSPSGPSSLPDVELGSSTPEASAGSVVEASGDLDGDGIVDALVAASGTQSVFWAAGSREDGGFALTLLSDFSSEIGELRDVRAGDRNQDGYADAFVSMDGEGAAIWIIEGGRGLESPATERAPLEGLGSIAVDDWNGDGADDVLGRTGENGQVLLGGPLNESEHVSWLAEDAAFADLNGDGFPDLLVGRTRDMNPSTARGIVRAIRGGRDLDGASVDWLLRNPLTMEAVAPNNFGVLPR
ncbi:MAG TPA: FG-GAP-like repeat-containing protein [Polyangiaceae bacterium LLY-WYZ-15_(1-7)]|nr:FG-GAP-like repeat-containing protein [Polyangiaceae bacterium LLY-WYZ-15_(1-7)]HJL00999.1 FG-GAP-like repeat-containing protein [Polyangiaceae bacterium LLY-WYZ-15_(1-7)]HJL12159.1 FG-GAP-like repeat-containing protein [Polyangiaceae bacterium LLY-WYZ-15_(1-7)]HJL26243.1 FG-GAP-like repeat-containing protein [Polyangiaceae bacterium LLY-WYZ-15_(1-7)]HJL30656.1 FG-GAP-like repeat-containing protein [Polyangiaceae bacterium LLY-WYZ-15_(1-7)]